MDVHLVPIDFNVLQQLFGQLADDVPVPVSPDKEGEAAVVPAKAGHSFTPPWATRHPLAT